MSYSQPTMQSCYYAVIFSSQRTNSHQREYEAMSERMLALARTQKGFRGIESARDANGFGITVSYWDSIADIQAWKQNAEHQEAQQLGRSTFYDSFTTRICKVEREQQSRPLNR